MNANAKTVSLVLGSGGARGYAHIGVIEELLAQGFEIRSVAGASMGALVGGIYTAGKLDAYRDWTLTLQKFDVLRLLDWTFRGGLIKGDRIIGRLRELIGDVLIENLPIPYTAVAVDILAQREIWFTHGPLFDAIRASIAIPTVFRPHHYEGRVLVDGGLLNPVPITPTLRDLTDCTIAVDLNAAPDDANSASAPDANTDPGLLETFARSLDAVQSTLTRYRLAAQPPDLLVTIPRSAGAFYEFHRAPELIELGRERTRAALAQWRGRIKSDGGPELS
ncbi:MAG: serine protease [Xanthomonadales bacterium PRO7]|jgi:NTE family protein|nr:serine protease [Xanthomonadales bacterium PRO7]HMM56049.1 patatin-like phospholipase family protein [Rudaea sp.]